MQKGWCWLCVRGELETGTDCHILTQSSSDTSSTSFFLGWAAQPCVTEGPSPLSVAGSQFSILSTTDSNGDWNWTRTDCPKPSVAPGYIIIWYPPASCGHTHLHRIQPRPQVKVIFRYLWPDAPVSLSFCLFTQVHLLIDSSVEGQYVTGKYNPVEVIL